MFLAYAAMVLDQMKVLSSLRPTLQLGSANARRVLEVLEADVEVVDRSGAGPLVVSGGEVVFEGEAGDATLTLDGQAVVDGGVEGIGGVGRAHPGGARHRVGLGEALEPEGVEGEEEVVRYRPAPSTNSMASL